MRLFLFLCPRPYTWEHFSSDERKSLNSQTDIERKSLNKRRIPERKSLRNCAIPSQNWEHLSQYMRKLGRKRGAFLLARLLHYYE
jgi:hypothetical protein